jgi:glucose/arabinose dehydrogenase
MSATVYILCLASLFANSTAPTAFPPKGSIPYLSPADELRTIQVADGYRLELVLSEPDIREPVSVMFDGNGRMYVAEMRTYMQDIDGSDELLPRSRVSRHESSRGDGRFDRHTVFADGLLLPRMLLPLDDRLIVGETNTNDLFVYRDTNGDGVSDQKLLFYEGGPRGGNLEHQPNGLLWSLDNWLYSTYNAYRLRWTPLGVVKEPTAPNGGQWGVTQDDHGKVWFSNAGGERGILNFQTHIAYGAFDVPQQQDADFREVFPLVGIPDVQGGLLRFRPGDKTVNHFTGTCGQTVYRGDRLPVDLRGDVLLPEPVGRLIRRIKVEMRDGITHVRNPYPKSEFIRSTDPNFRPINMTTGPDGAIYIVDMYRGIIQEGNWVRPDSYLRTVVTAHGLQHNFGRGRIWRLVHEG